MDVGNSKEIIAARTHAIGAREHLEHSIPDTRHARSVVLSYGIFFLSGAAALIYEISWSRQIGLVLGQTAHAAAVVLSAYFAGLAFGYWLLV